MGRILVGSNLKGTPGKDGKNAPNIFFGEMFKDATNFYTDQDDQGNKCFIWSVLSSLGAAEGDIYVETTNGNVFTIGAYRGSGTYLCYYKMNVKGPAGSKIHFKKGISVLNNDTPVISVIDEAVDDIVVDTRYGTVYTIGDYYGAGIHFLNYQTGPSMEYQIPPDMFNVENASGTFKIVNNEYVVFNINIDGISGLPMVDLTKIFANYGRVLPFPRFYDDDKYLADIVVQHNFGTGSNEQNELGYGVLGKDMKIHLYDINGYYNFYIYMKYII